jgi:hypothetical protein
MLAITVEALTSEGGDDIHACQVQTLFQAPARAGMGLR